MFFQIKGAFYFHVSDIYAIRSDKLDFHLSRTGENQDPERISKQIPSLKERTKKAMKMHMEKVEKTVLDLLEIYM